MSLNPDTQDIPVVRPHRETKLEKKETRDRNLRLSFAFYLALFLLLAQFAANVIGRIPFNTIFLIINGAIVLGGLFGSNFVVEFTKAVRGSRDNDQGGDTDA